MRQDLGEELANLEPGALQAIPRNRIEQLMGQEKRALYLLCQFTRLTKFQRRAVVQGVISQEGNPQWPLQPYIANSNNHGMPLNIFFSLLESGHRNRSGGGTNDRVKSLLTMRPTFINELVNLGTDDLQGILPAHVRMLMMWELQDLAICLLCQFDKLAENQRQVIMEECQ